MDQEVAPDFSRSKYPVFVSVGAPIFVTPSDSLDDAMNQLSANLQELLNQVQKDYPDSPIGQRWAPASLGGTAPTKQELMAAKESRKEL